MQQRKHLRVPFTGTAELPTEKPPMAVTVGNISVGGLHLYCPKSFDLGQRLVVRVCGVHGGLPFSELVEGKVVVVHRRADGNSYGVQFAPYLSEQRQPGLYRWVDESTKTVGSPSFLRNIPSA